MNKKKDFWDMSWNPVWGCKNNCPYCYAKKIAKRYAKQIAEKEFYYFDNLEIKKYNRHLGYYILQINLEKFNPTWLESNYVRKFPKKPSIIFVNSMSDPAYWEQKWYKKILKRICENMQHTFVVLTKTPEIYKKFTFPHNTIIGVTIVDTIDFKYAMKFFNNLYATNKKLLSIEPIQKKIEMSIVDKRMIESNIDWIHVGQESGNRKGRVTATPEMIEPFFDFDMGKINWMFTKVFMKKNLENVVPGRKLRRERIDETN